MNYLRLKHVRYISYIQEINGYELLFSFAKKKDVNIITAIKYGYLGIVKYLFYIGENEVKYEYLEDLGPLSTFDLIHLAVTYGHLDIIKYLYNRGLPLYHYHMTEAIDNNKLDIIRYFCSLGLGEPADLELAAKKCYFDIVKILIMYIDRTKAKYAIDYAVENGDYETVKYLLDHGFRCVNAVDIAAAGNDMDMVKLLIKRDKQFQNAIEIAKLDGNIILLNYLEKHKHLKRKAYW